MKITPALYDRYAKIFTKIAAKVCKDENLREDCVQEGFMAMLDLNPERATGPLDAYIRGAAKNAMLSFLASHKTGDWYTGRTEWRGRNKGQTPYKRKSRARYMSVDGYLDMELLQIDSAGRLLPGEGSQYGDYQYTRRLADGGLTVILSL